MTTFLYTSPIELSSTATIKCVAVDTEGVSWPVQEFAYTISAEGAVAADAMSVTPTMTSAELDGVLATNSMTVTPSATVAQLVGVLAADSMTIAPTMTTAALVGVAVADDLTVTPVMTVAELQASLSGSGSIRSPSGATLRRATGTATIRRYISGVWL